jgi:hypothetical protein
VDVVSCISVSINTVTVFFSCNRLLFKDTSLYMSDVSLKVLCRLHFATANSHKTHTQHCINTFINCDVLTFIKYCRTKIHKPNSNGLSVTGIKLIIRIIFRLFPAHFIFNKNITFMSVAYYPPPPTHTHTKSVTTRHV